MLDRMLDIMAIPATIFLDTFTKIISLKKIFADEQTIMGY